MKIKLLLLFTCTIVAGTIYSHAQQLWAITEYGGDFGGGTIIGMNPDGSGFQVEFSYQCTATSGCRPMGNLMQASNGQLYGTCYLGGQFSSCTVDRYDPVTGTYYDIHDFDIVNGDYPYSGLVEAPNGKLYGVASTTTMPLTGAIYSINLATNAYAVEHFFTANTGCFPYSCPILKNGILYGVTNQGGTGNAGVLYSFNIVTNTYTVLHNFFAATTGSFPRAALYEASNGLFYGVTLQGGPQGFGTIFSFNPATNTLTTVHSFNGGDGSNPHSALMQAADGKLYGTAMNGGSNNMGVLFSYDIVQNTFTQLYDFNQADGRNPNANLYQSPNLLLYGTTYNGGVSDMGVLFSYNIATDTYTSMVDFTGGNGSHPSGGFVMVEMPTAIATSSSNVFSIYPNPANEAIHLTFAKTARYTIELRNITGEILLREENHSAYSTIDVVGLPKGIYFVEVKEDNGKITAQKIVKM